MTRDFIFIKDLTLDISIGITPEEAGNPQPVLLSLKAYTDHPLKPEQDDISETVSYSEMIDVITHIAQARHFNLVETLADEIADTLLARLTMLKHIEIHVSKPEIIPNAAGVGVVIHRSRDAV